MSNEPTTRMKDVAAKADAARAVDLGRELGETLPRLLLDAAGVEKARVA